MKRQRRKLTSLEVNRINEVGKHPLGENLYLQVTKNGTKSWLFRYTANGKARWMGIGSIKLVTLAEAREKVIDKRRILQEGIDPLVQRDLEETIQKAKAITFDECAKKYISAHKPKWKSNKNLVQWESSLRNYASPICGHLSIGEIDTKIVMKVLEPIWYKKTETASRVRARMERIISWATVRGYREGQNPAQWRWHLEQLLPKKSSLAAVNHFAALPFENIAEFMNELKKSTSVSSRAMEFLILTATRTNEALGARWSEIDFENRCWTIPANRMKANKEHKIPLSKRCIEILEKMNSLRSCELIFTGSKPNNPLSDMSLLMVLRRKKLNVTTHGFRSTFSDWAAERTNFSREVVEMALAHTIKNKVEAAYRRGDLFSKRQKLMDLWSKYCLTKQPDYAPILNIKEYKTS